MVVSETARGTAMPPRTWLITGVSSGFGRELTSQLLERGERVVGTVRRLDAAADLFERHPNTFHAELLDVTDTKAIREVVDRSFAELGRIDVIVSNAGYGLFGAAEELSDEQVERIIDTNLWPSRGTRSTTPRSGASRASWSRSRRRWLRSGSA
jgi:NAD(P)-dependent dehydrogenase (short-subunit alcohol dehydrogenase family)